MTTDYLKSSPIRHGQLPHLLLLRAEAVRSVLEEVLPISADEWMDSLRRDLNPEQEVVWWERVAGCYTRFLADTKLLSNHRQSAFKVILGSFLGLHPEQFRDDLASLPKPASKELIANVRNSFAK